VQEINLYDLLKHYAKYWLFIVTFSFIGLVAGLVFNNIIQTPMYKSDATLIVLNTTGTAESKATTINNYIELLKSRRVLEPVIKELKLEDSYDNIVTSISATNNKDTEVVKLSISTDNAEKSRKLTESTINSFKDEISKLYKTNTIQVIDGASSPTKPYNTRKTIQLVLFTSAGFLFSIIVVFFIYDYRLNSAAKGTPVGTESKTDNKKSATKIATKPARDLKTGKSTAKSNKSTNKSSKKK
jgi:capsular polysaccharide biosynthesis protein